MLIRTINFISLRLSLSADNKKIKKWVYKPGSVSRFGRDFYHLSSPAVANRVMRPTLLNFFAQGKKTGRAALQFIRIIEIYMALQPMRCTASDVTIRTGGLLPHLFTLIPPKRDGYFLLHYYTLTSIFLLGSMVLCVARTFLHRHINPRR